MVNLYNPRRGFFLVDAGFNRWRMPIINDLSRYAKVMEVQPKNIQNYLRGDGSSPFEEWLDSLRDTKTVAKIKKRLRRVELGNLGDYRSVGEGVYELKVDYGPGYRVYFGQVGLTIVLLLCGGDKSSQNQDIKQAKKYWVDYERTQSANQ